MGESQPSGEGTGTGILYGTGILVYYIETE
jgi:hypothetical protein